jgi:hypothetical protein
MEIEFVAAKTTPIAKTSRDGMMVHLAILGFKVLP